MTIAFRNLSEHDFPLLLKWLETPHVKSWWDSEVVWTLDKITQKYSSYVNQYKIENGVNGYVKARINGAGFDPLIAAEASKIGLGTRASMRAWF